MEKHANYSRQSSEQPTLGGYGVVSIVLDSQRSALVASKRLPCGNVDQRASAMLEVQALAACRHPHAIRLLDWYEHEGSFYIICEQAHGFLSVDRPLAMSQSEWSLRVAEDLAEILCVLDSMHDAGYAHNDIKWDNFMKKNGHVKLIDFGSCRKGMAGVSLPDEGQEEVHGLAVIASVFMLPAALSRYAGIHFT
jgi:serine/threonine protein kinase